MQQRDMEPRGHCVENPVSADGAFSVPVVQGTHLERTVGLVDDTPAVGTVVSAEDLRPKLIHDKPTRSLWKRKVAICLASGVLIFGMFLATEFLLRTPHTCRSSGDQEFIHDIICGNHGHCRAGHCPVWDEDSGNCGYCECLDGYTGEKCDRSPHGEEPCPDVPCGVNMKCLVDERTSYRTCVCTGGYVGVNCDEIGRSYLGIGQENDGQGAAGVTGAMSGWSSENGPGTMPGGLPVPGQRLVLPVDGMPTGAPAATARQCCSQWCATGTAKMLHADVGECRKMCGRGEDGQDTCSAAECDNAC
jgi:hypothetical protein